VSDRHQIQWHSRVHREWARERLVFWRLGFYPTYRRADVMSTVDLVCARHGIRARIVYEVLGQHDLLARLWIPAATTPEQVDRDLKRTLAAFHLELCDMFSVDDVLLHWFWDEDIPGDPAPPKPQESDLAAVPPPRVMIEVSALIDRYNSGTADLEEVRANTWAESYFKAGLLAVRPRRQGIKFAVVVSTSGDLSSRFTAMESLGDQLGRILNKATRIYERSLYSGSGFGRFLLLGKLDPVDFFAINEDLISPIVDEASLSGVYRTRSVTYIANSPDQNTFSEGLAIPQDDLDEDTVDIEDVLAGGENARVEFKASAFVNVNRWLNTGERVEDEQVIMAFTRAVAAMLNGNGGTVVSGVLEGSTRDYSERVTGVPVRGELIILGVEFDLVNWSRPTWDEFENRLRQKLNALIEPTPLDMITIEQHSIDSRTVCTVAVQAGATRWFYFKKSGSYEFVVRRGASSVAISGPQEEAYKSVTNRGL
jgi:schlafen family protein